MPGDSDNTFERDAIEQMLESAGWRLYIARLDRAIEGETGNCLQVGADPREADVARGAVRALKAARGFPKQMLGEYAKESSDARKVR